MDNFVRCHAGVQLICSEAILPSIQKVLEDWHQRCLRNCGSCTQKTCPNKGKPKPNKGFCKSCVDWGKAIEQAYYPQSNIAFIKWNNVDPTLFCKDPIEVAKVFVLRLQQGQVYGSLDDFDAASLLMLAMHFTPYHQGNQAFYEQLQKILKLRHELSHLNIKDNMELDDQVTAQSFDDMRDLIPFLIPRYFTKDIGDQLQLEISKIETSPVSERMKDQALSPLSEGMKRTLIGLLEERLKEEHKHEDDPHGEAKRPSLDIELCRRQLKEHYLQNLCKIPKHPGDSETFLEMDEIYTTLSLHYEIAKPGAPIKIPLKSYHEMLTRKVNGMLPKRILVLGRGGSGKTTLFAKLAYDWATESAESPLKDTPLVFVLNMRWMEYSSSVEDAILHQLLPRDTEITKESLSHFLKENPDSVMILLDSYDEFSRGEILGSNENVEGNVVDILASRCLTSCRMLVSSRHWRASDFAELNNVYAKIEVEGFSEEKVKEYIMKNVQESPESGKRLCDYITNNNLFHIAANPLMAQLFCLFWKETKEEEIPSKIGDLYTAVFRILYNHLLAKRKGTTQLHLSTLQEVVLQLGECALLGLWPPQNKLVFPYEEIVQLTSMECVEDGCKTGIISVQKMTSTYKPVQGHEHGEIHEQKSVVFFHKSAQEKCAGEYLAHLADTNPKEFHSKLTKLDTVQKCLSVQMVLRFACGRSLKAAELILHKLLNITRTELIDDIPAFYADELRDPDRAKYVQDFIEVCLLCNYESGSSGQFNRFLSELFSTEELRFLGLTPYTSSAIAHFLRFQETRPIITHIKLMQIPKIGVDTKYDETSAMADALLETTDNIIKQMPSNEEIDNICADYVEGHHSSSNFADTIKYFKQDTTRGLMLIHVWEYFNTWHSSHCQMNIDPILDAVKFTSLINKLSLIDIKLPDAGLKLLTVMEQGHLIHLTHLMLPDCGLSTETMNSMVAIPGAILPQCTPNLRVLDISRNDANDSEVILNLSRSLPFLSVHELHLHYMHVPASNMTALAQVMPQVCTHLTELHIYGNNMDDETGKTLASTLPHAQQLETLGIGVDGMSRKIHRALVMTMGRLVQLERLGMYDSPYVDDLVLYTGNVLKSLSNLRVIHLRAATGDTDADVQTIKVPLLRRFLVRIGKSQEETSERTVQTINRKSWRSFMSSLQPKAAQMTMLYLWNINLHEADLADLLTLCREYDMELGYDRRLWPDGLDIPQDVIVTFS